MPRKYGCPVTLTGFILLLSIVLIIVRIFVAIYPWYVPVGLFGAWALSVLWRAVKINTTR
jgi:hypothetical protein